MHQTLKHNHLLFRKLFKKYAKCQKTAWKIKVNFPLRLLDMSILSFLICNVSFHRGFLINLKVRHIHESITISLSIDDLPRSWYE